MLPLLSAPLQNFSFSALNKTAGLTFSVPRCNALHTVAAKARPQVATDTPVPSLAQQFQLTATNNHRLNYQRNIGVSARITECILYYTGRI
jgi:hypothetical protein